MASYDPHHNRESESPATELRCEKWIECTGLVFGGHATALIRNFNECVRARYEGFAKVRALQGFALQSSYSRSHYDFSGIPGGCRG